MPPLPEPAAAQQQPVKKNLPGFDAQQYLHRTLSRQPGDVIKIFPMHGLNSFRVNWYSTKPSQQGTIPGLTTSYIRQSQYLFCRLNAQGTPEIAYPAKQ